MHLSIVLLASLAFPTAISSAPPEPHTFLQDLQDRAISSLREQESQRPRSNYSTCTLDTAAVRRNWAVLTPSERKSYIAAVQCLFSSPSHLNTTLVPGALTRYDDFVATHINQTRSIHGTGNFLSWHRYFVHAYENALREECGYAGVTPYWDWFAHTDDLRQSPVFDGSETSLGGDGAFVRHNGSLAGGGAIWVPSGEGGGCVGSGPFKGLQVSLGPVLASPLTPSAPSPLAPNPHCLTRDLSASAATTWLTSSNLHNLTLGPASTSIATFQSELQGRFSDGFLGMHAAGHFAIGGDAGDFYSSVNDPAFWLHHAMLDRVWWMWQALRPGLARSVAGTVTVNNVPPSRNASVGDVLMGFAGLGVEEVRIGDVLDTLGGGLCYVYE